MSDVTVAIVFIFKTIRSGVCSVPVLYLLTAVPVELTRTPSEVTGQLQLPRTPPQNGDIRRKKEANEGGHKLVSILKNEIPRPFLPSLK